MAFVGSFAGVRVGSGSAVGAAGVSSRRGVVRMGVLDGLDKSSYRAYTNNKVQPFEFSRYILGPFQAVRPSQNPDVEEKDVAVAAAYRQVFGNAYIMEEERAEVAYEESQFRIGRLSTRDFVRALAKTGAYKKRFFDGASNYRFIELNFKHLLGRSPDNYKEMFEYSNRLISEGYDALIDSIVDSEEYFSVFGLDAVPFLRFRGAYTPCDSFNRQCALQGGWANSDKAMGGAAITGYNGADGQQTSELISTYISGTPVPASKVYANTPLKTTAPNWYAVPDTNIPSGPELVCQKELDILAQKVSDCQDKYEQAVESKSNYTGIIDTWREAAKEIKPEQGFVFGGNVSYYGNPLPVDESPLISGGQKTSDAKRYTGWMTADNVSVAEAELEAAKREYMVAVEAFNRCTPAQRVLAETLAESSGKLQAAAAAKSVTKIGRPKIVVS
eukprot:CAMPEP_0198324504 /NCGR_PEP_ID=MMETSP1450-20131203/12498_1 /TAXON_ID=753684 ORGANISM="Madagascaria erythrocladiodes, Strain CCMP3234" /NCGR_SAMPLE_ID=MMETSP1450 /ASSEMBLY_ACC=CAM_ASM_001115 /LENGTH=443 /DNA_ID=CAMNT_0044028307 /DNA_START=47 /DNA_END=1381 /DNA_ORIENTATION=-